MEAGRIFPQGGVIFWEGSRSTCMYYVRSGRVGIYSQYGTEGAKLLTALEPGSFFGEMGMVRGFPRSATAVALLPGTEIETVTWETLSGYFHTEPAKVVGIMQQMANRIAELTDDYIGACGEITRLVEERAPLKQAPRTAHREQAGKSQRNDSARLKKYVDAYRRYLNSHYEESDVFTRGG